MIGFSKYRAVKTHSELINRTFDSKLEAKRAEQLWKMQENCIISSLEFQKEIVLNKKPSVKLVCDFHYYNEETGEWVWEDAKGKLMPDFRVKMIWVKEKFDIDIKLWPEKKKRGRKKK